MINLTDFQWAGVIAKAEMWATHVNPAGTVYTFSDFSKIVFDGESVYLVTANGQRWLDLV